MTHAADPWQSFSSACGRPTFISGAFTQQAPSLVSTSWLLHEGDIRSIQRMPAFAVRFGDSSTPGVFSSRDRLQMVRIDAPSMGASIAAGAGEVGIVTGVIQAHAVWDRASQLLVHKAMGLYCSPSVPGNAVSVSVNRHEPRPAVIRSTCDVRGERGSAAMPFDEPLRFAFRQSAAVLVRLPSWERCPSAAALTEAGRDGTIRLHRTLQRSAAVPPDVRASRGFRCVNYTRSAHDRERSMDLS